jgi:hypothetical protein
MPAHQIDAAAAAIAVTPDTLPTPQEATPTSVRQRRDGAMSAGESGKSAAGVRSVCRGA